MKKIFRIVFVITILIEGIGMFGLLPIAQDFTWLGLFVSFAFAWAMLEMLQFSSFVWISVSLLLILDVISALFGFYSSIYIWDKLIHFCGGSMIAIASLELILRILKNEYIRTLRTNLFIIINTFLSVTFIGFLYEVLEYLVDKFQYGYPKSLVSAYNSIEDQLFNILGASLVLITYYFWQKYKGRLNDNFKNFMKKNIISSIILLVLVVGVGVWYVNDKVDKNSLPSLIVQVSYICNDSKTINISFYKGAERSVQPGEMPIPSGSVKIVLSDGRNLDLSQTISADGARYANSDESFVFWSKGNGALVLENNVEKSYIGCIVLAKDPGGLSNVYLDSTTGFSVRYPQDYSINTEYKYQALGPGKDISGVKFTIPDILTTGTNLSSFDTGFSVEIIPNTQDCNAGLFLDSNIPAQIITDNNIDYSFAATIQAAAGNRYEEEVWAIPGTNPCLGMRYFVHYGDISNYPAGTIQEFDRTSLMEQFDKIRQSLITL